MEFEFFAPKIGEKKITACWQLGITSSFKEHEDNVLRRFILLSSENYILSINFQNIFCIKTKKTLEKIKIDNIYLVCTLVRKRAEREREREAMYSFN